jgi:hypothetical protein
LRDGLAASVRASVLLATARDPGWRQGREDSLRLGNDEVQVRRPVPEGTEIPVPKRDAVLRDLMKAAPKAEPAKRDDDE